MREYGLDVEQLPRLADPVRLAAVRAVIFSGNYQIRDGHLTAEGISSWFRPPIQEALQALLAENDARVGYFTIHLFNDDVSGFVLQRTLPWFSV